MSATRVIISGRVQGVGYRAWTVRKASEMGLAGWVRNRSDGTVEAVFSGEDAVIFQMIEHCKDGPMLARVDGITSYAHDDPVGETSFVSKPTV
jgi:acylphosphatase